MREITTHRVNPANDKLQILVVDEPGSGGAHHEYRISFPVTQPLNEKPVSGGDVIPIDPPHGEPLLIQDKVTSLSFQNGPITEVGVNGITHEALIAVLIDRLECFERGPYHHYRNEMALKSLREAAHHLAMRTAERMARGVEGTHQI